MSEYWKSTPKYWCKHCTMYVRDTKLERANHEATAKHQSGLKRFLRDLHRGHENEEREKERAKREVDRLNGVKPTFPPGPSSSRPGASSSSSSQSTTNAQRQKQWEQLAEMGIEVPTELRGDMAMAGEWTVTNTRVIKEIKNDVEDEDVDVKVENLDSVATGVRKRPKPEDEDEENAKEEKAALDGLFKKPRKWGRDTNDGFLQNDDDLDALLSAPLVKQPKKEEEDSDEGKTDVKKEQHADATATVKRGDGEDDNKPAIRDGSPGTPIKEEDPEESILPPVSSEPGTTGEDVKPVKSELDAEPAAPAVIFKQRKAKKIRQK